MGSKAYSSIGTPLIGTTTTGLDQLVEAISKDPGLAGANLGSQIRDGQTAADGINKLILEAAQATGGVINGVFTTSKVVAINAWIRQNRLAAFTALHGDDNGTQETGFHLVQGDGGTRQYRGANLINTVLDGIYHIGFEIKNNAFLNEDGNANASVTQVANWLTQFYTDRATTNTGLDRITELVLADAGLATKISWNDVAGGASAANSINQLYKQAIAELSLGSSGVISQADILQINNWIRSDATRYELFAGLHGNDDGATETGFHLVQNDGATTTYFGKNLVDVVTEGIYNVGFEINNGILKNEDGNANATVKDVADWVTYFYVDQSTTGTGLDRIVDTIKIDTGLAAATNAGDINQGAAAANSLNQLIVNAIQATNVGSDGWITTDDIRTVNNWIRTNYYDNFVVLHGDDETGTETGYHLVQNDGGTTQYFGKNLINTVADGIYHIGFSIEGENFLNEDGNANASVSDVASWVNYFYGNKTIIYGTDEVETITGTDQGEQILAYAGDDIVKAGAANDLVDGGEGNDLLNGDSGDDILYGFSGNDTLNGGMGNDSLYGGVDDDLLNGGENSDNYIVSGNQADGWLTFQGYDTYQDTGTTGSDRLVAIGTEAVDIGLLSFGMVNGIEVIDGTGTTGTVRLVGDWDANELNFLTVQFMGSNIQIDGGEGDDIITGNASDNIIIGGLGDDILNGGNGSDSYIVTGNEEGGWSSFQGYDTYADTGTGTTDSDRLVAVGTDVVNIGLLNFSLTNGIEVIDGTETTGKVILFGDSDANQLDFSAVQFVGSNIEIDGNEGDDQITGNSADNTIIGGGGDDSLNGGEGSDSYIVTGNEASGWSSFQGYDTYQDTGKTGSDRLVASGTSTVDIGLSSFNVTNSIEVIDGTGATGMVSLLGDWDDNQLDFSSVQFVGSNIQINGGYGADTVTGNSGDNIIIGGGDDDLLKGGEGSDKYIVTGNEAEGWSSFQGYDTYQDTGTTGSDRIVASGTGAVSIGLANFSATNGIEIIDGTAAKGKVSLLGDWNDNQLDFSSVQFNGSNIQIDGDSGDDLITGNSGNNTLIGGLGNDTLNGGNGSDRYLVTGNQTVGFQGYDTYKDTGTVTGDSDRIFASSTGAVDIQLSNFNGANGIEVIDGTGATGTVRLVGDWDANQLNFSTTAFVGSNLKIDGGYGDDTITGNSADNTIIGGGGNDSLNGGNGSDKYIVTGNELGGWSSFQDYDTYKDTGTVGTDRIVASGKSAVDVGLLNFSTANGIEIIDGAGVTGTVRLLGNWDNNQLNFSGIQLLGSNIKIDGGSGNDTLTGSNTSDVILGGGGNDQLTGNLGVDRLTGGQGKDFFIFRTVAEVGLGTAKDVITDFTKNQDLINLKTIDANTLVAGDQAFTYIATSAFTGAAGQLRFTGGILSGDVNGDKANDFELAINAVTSLTAANFVL